MPGLGAGGPIPGGFRNSLSALLNPAASGAGNRHPALNRVGVFLVADLRSRALPHRCSRSRSLRRSSKLSRLGAAIRLIFGLTFGTSALPKRPGGPASVRPNRNVSGGLQGGAFGGCGKREQGNETATDDNSRFSQLPCSTTAPARRARRRFFSKSNSRPHSTTSRCPSG